MHRHTGYIIAIYCKIVSRHSAHNIILCCSLFSAQPFAPPVVFLYERMPCHSALDFFELLLQDALVEAQVNRVVGPSCLSPFVPSLPGNEILIKRFRITCVRECFDGILLDKRHRDNEVVGAVRRGTSGVPRGTLGVPLRTKGCPRGSQGYPRGPPGGSRGTPGGPLGIPGDPRVSVGTPGVPLGTPGVPLERTFLKGLLRSTKSSADS